MFAIWQGGTRVEGDAIPRKGKTMRQWIRSHLTYANVMVTILAFLVLGGGTALASFVVSSNSQIGRSTVSGHNPPSGKHANIIKE